MRQAIFKGYKGLEPSEYCDLLLLKEGEKYWIEEDPNDRHGDIKVLIHGRFCYEKMRFFAPCEGQPA